jgi:pyruvate kinase
LQLKIKIKEHFLFRLSIYKPSNGKYVTIYTKKMKQTLKLQKLQNNLHCFFLQTWQQASQYCQRMGGSLPVITSAAQNAFVSRNFGTVSTFGFAQNMPLNITSMALS